MIPRFNPVLGGDELRAAFACAPGTVTRFEVEFAQTFGAVAGLAFPYGRSALWAFFKAVGLEQAEVILPAYTCSVVAHAVVLSGNHSAKSDAGWPSVSEGCSAGSSNATASQTRSAER